MMEEQITPNTSPSVGAGDALLNERLKTLSLCLQGTVQQCFTCYFIYFEGKHSGRLSNNIQSREENRKYLNQST